MLPTERQNAPVVSSQKGRTLNECFAYLDSIAPIRYNPQSNFLMQEMNALLNNPLEKIDSIIIGGSNDKNTTMFFTSKVLQEENMLVGTIYSTQLLSYHERIFINDQPVSNKILTEALNTVIDASLKHNLEATAFELILLAGFLIFVEEGVSVALVETGIGGRLDATAALKAKIYAITKVTPRDGELLGYDLDQIAYEMMSGAKTGSWFISSEQSKLRLQKMKVFAEQQNLQWAMPTRKLSSLPYIYEQLFGKNAALAERISQIYIENVKGLFSPFLRGNLLATKKGQRGRPSVEVKRDSLTNPLKTIKTFWNDNFALKKGVFEVLDKEKPTILLDEASDEDALSRLFLGLRLLHYKKPINEICIIMGLERSINLENVLRMVRYLFKKINGEVYFVPLQTKIGYAPDKLCATAKSLGVRATAFKSVKEAFDIAKKTVNERDGVLCLSGDLEIISTYWKQIREVKKI